MSVVQLLPPTYLLPLPLGEGFFPRVGWLA